MKNVIAVSLMLIVFASCQSQKAYRSRGHAERSIANTRLLKSFIDDIARQSSRSGQRYTSEQIERKVLEYLKRQEKDMAHGNWSKMGISKVQADDMKSLYDDLPYTNKVHKWVAENITKVIKISDDVAASAYSIMMKRSKSSINPYTFGKNQSNQLMMSRRSNTSPFKSVNQKGARVYHRISEVKNQTIKKIYMENYINFSKRGSKNPGIMANAHESIESATQITRKTGHTGMGKGCKSFNEKASFELIETKANIDIYRARLIEEKAYRKAGREFASVDDIAKNKRLTTKEIDEATEEAFENVLGYTKLEARAAVKRLKGKPCRVY